MMKPINKLKSGLIILAVLVGITILLSYKSYNQSKHLSVDKGIALETFTHNNGWGYRIIKNGRVFINQDCIPAIPGNKPFKTEEDALKTGGIVLAKVENQEIPNIGLTDLDSLGIVY